MTDNADLRYAVDVARDVIRSQESHVAYLLAALENILRSDNAEDPREVARRAIRTLHQATLVTNDE